MVVPLILQDPLLVLGHNQNRHNGSRRTYNALKRSYYWPNMKKEVFKNLRRAREKENTETQMSLQNHLKIGDLVLVRNINSGVFEPKYSPNYRIIAIYGNNHIAVKALDGKVQVWHRGHIKKIDAVDKVILLLPSTEDYQKFGRKTKLLIHPDNIPDTSISLPSRTQTEETTEESEICENYQDSCEKLEISSMENTKNNKLQPTMTGNESEFGKNYQNS